MNAFFSRLASSNFNKPVAAHLLSLVSNFSKYISKARAKRLPLNTKRAGKGYYKGNRCRKEGTINSKGSQKSWNLFGKPIVATLCDSTSLNPILSHLLNCAIFIFDVWLHRTLQNEQVIMHRARDARFYKLYFKGVHSTWSEARNSGNECHIVTNVASLLQRCRESALISYSGRTFIELRKSATFEFGEIFNYASEKCI